MPEVEIENLSFFYPESKNGIEAINLTVEKGEKIGIIGPNGSGKTTLLLCIAGILKFRGRIKICGEVLKSGNTKGIFRKVGIMFQDPEDQIFMPTVFDEITFTLRRLKTDEQQIIKRAKEILSITGLSEMENREPHRMSFGEKKKLTLATAIAHNPPLLLLDEPTLGLDMKESKRILSLIQKLPQTVLITGHDLETVKDVVNRVIVMNEGKVISVSSIHEALRNENILRVLQGD